MLIRKQEDWLSANVAGEVVMMSARTGRHIGLNKVGARIWDILDRPRTLDEICGILVQRFDVAPDVCRTEVESFLGELQQHGAITIEDAASI
jgi:hypothetical protein